MKFKILVAGIVGFLFGGMCFVFLLNYAFRTNTQSELEKINSQYPNSNQTILTVGQIQINTSKLLSSNLATDTQQRDLKHIAVLPTVYFSFQSSLLSTSYHSQLDYVFDVVNTWPSVHRFIIGYAAKNKTKAMQLALQRAEMVQSFLVRKGIDKSRLNTIAAGDLLAQDVLQSEEQHNRKVRFRVY